MAPASNPIRPSSTKACSAGNPAWAKPTARAERTAAAGAQGADRGDDHAGRVEVGVRHRARHVHGVDAEAGGELRLELGADDRGERVGARGRRAEGEHEHAEGDRLHRSCAVWPSSGRCSASPTSPWWLRPPTTISW
jgi:hypothetical protein